LWSSLKRALKWIPGRSNGIAEPPIHCVFKKIICQKSMNTIIFSSMKKTKTFLTAVLLLSIASTSFIATANGKDDGAENVKIKTNYHDLPAGYREQLKEALKTGDLSVLTENSLTEIMLFILNHQASQFGNSITTSYFWHVYNNLPEFVAEEERHQGYYRNQNNSPVMEKLMAYGIYRIDRSPENLKRLFAFFKPFLKQVLSPQEYQRYGIAQKVRWLIYAYKDIIKIPEYSEKLEAAYTEIEKKKPEYQNSAYGLSVWEQAEFIKKNLGYSRHDSPNYQALSFWMRRNHEKNMDTVYDILVQIQQMYEQVN
jgi:hypothetical protein